MTLERVPDDLPRRGVFAEPLRVAQVRTAVEPLAAGQVRVAFTVTVRDALGRRCPDLAVEGRIDGPERSGSGLANTDLAGRATFRMVGPQGRYRFEVLDVAAGALVWDRAGSTVTATLDV